MAVPAEKLDGFRRRFAKRFGAWPQRGDTDNGTLLPHLFEMIADELDALRKEPDHLTGAAD